MSFMRKKKCVVCGGEFVSWSPTAKCCPVDVNPRCLGEHRRAVKDAANGAARMRRAAEKRILAQT